MGKRFAKRGGGEGWGEVLWNQWVSGLLGKVVGGRFSQSDPGWRVEGRFAKNRVWRGLAGVWNQ